MAQLDDAGVPAMVEYSAHVWRVQCRNLTARSVLVSFLRRVLPARALPAARAILTVRCWGVGDVLSRGPSHTGEFVLPSTTLSSSPGNFGAADHLPPPHSPYSNPPSLPTSNPPTSNPPSEMHEEDDLAQATIGHSIAQASPNTFVPQAAVQAATSAPMPGETSVGGTAAAAEALAVPPGSVVAVTTSVAVATVPLPAAVVAPAEQALPPTEVNIARHTHALAATVGPAPQQQKVGRFNIKKKLDHTTSDNGSAATMPGSPPAPAPPAR